MRHAWLTKQIQAVHLASRGIYRVEVELHVRGKDSVNDLAPPRCPNWTALTTSWALPAERAPPGTYHSKPSSLRVFSAREIVARVTR